MNIKMQVKRHVLQRKHQWKNWIQRKCDQKDTGVFKEGNRPFVGLRALFVGTRDGCATPQNKSKGLLRKRLYSLYNENSNGVVSLYTICCVICAVWDGKGFKFADSSWKTWKSLIYITGQTLCDDQSLILAANSLRFSTESQQDGDDDHAQELHQKERAHLRCTKKMPLITFSVSSTFANVGVWTCNNKIIRKISRRIWYSRTRKNWGERQFLSVQETTVSLAYRPTFSVRELFFFLGSILRIPASH